MHNNGVLKTKHVTRYALAKSIKFFYPLAFMIQFGIAWLQRRPILSLKRTCPRVRLVGVKLSIAGIIIFLSNQQSGFPHAADNIISFNFHFNILFGHPPLSILCNNVGIGGESKRRERLENLKEKKCFIYIVWNLDHEPFGRVCSH